MLYLGCHLSISRGYQAMGQDALSIGANTFAFFTRNPRGGRARALDLEDIAGLKKIVEDHNFGPLVAHAPYTLNPASKTERTLEFAYMAFEEDLLSLEHLPGSYYNFHPGSHVGQGVEKGISLVVDLLNEKLWDGMQTTVLLETMAGKGTELGRNFEELARIIDGVKLKDKIGVCLDTCHVHDGGYPIGTHLSQVLEEFDRVIGLDKLKALHLNDSKNVLGSRKDRHETIGNGALGLEFFSGLINHEAIKSLPLILETPQEDLRGYKEEINLLRSLEGKDHVSKLRI